jgi:O-antigen ligase
LLEWFVAAGSLFLLTGALDRTLHAWSSAATSPPLARTILIPFFAGAFLCLARHLRAAITGAAAAWPVMLLAVLAAASVFWSTDPAVTASWVAGLAGTTIVGVFLAVRFDLDEQLEVACAALGSVAAVSALVVVVWPAIGIRAPETRGLVWAGIFEDNNLFGRAMSLSALAFLVLALERRSARGVASAGCALSAVLLLGSRSLAAQLVAGTCAIATGALVRLRRQDRAARRRSLALAAVVAALGGALLVHGRDSVAAFLGRDLSLSGRTVLWSGTVQMAKERPWFGYGYATFWPRAQAAAEPSLAHVEGFPVRHPHNGFLEVLFELGLAGLLALLVPYLWLLRRAVARSLTASEALWPLAYLLFLALSNIAESDLLRHKIFWALYVAVAVDLCGTAPRRAAARSPAARQ